MATSPPEAPARKLRWFQYSLRSLFLLVFLVSIGMSWVAVKIERARRQKEAVEEIKKAGGHVSYDYQFDKSGDWLPEARPPGPAWLRNLLGEDFFATVVMVGLFPLNSRVTDAGLEHLKGLTQLEWLDLMDTPVTDAGLEHLKGLTQLQELYLGGTKVTDAGLDYLKGLTQLRTLYLGNTPVTDAGLEHLSGLTQLQFLCLENTQVTDEGAKRLQQALPKCRIER
jgi:hypothetical protein